jgi:hypothetical protein
MERMIAPTVKKAHHINGCLIPRGTRTVDKRFVVGRGDAFAFTLALATRSSTKRLLRRNVTATATPSGIGSKNINSIHAISPDVGFDPVAAPQTVMRLESPATLKT